MKKLLSGLVLALIPLVMSGCGSGDFSLFSGTTINGAASKGPIGGANIAIYAVTASGQIDTTKPLATATSGTDGSGSFSGNLGSYTGAIFATMSGSRASYTDETTNTTKYLGTTKLHAAAVITAPGPFNLAITPFTELAYQQAASHGGLTEAEINAANMQISNLFLQGTSIISTLPANILSTAPAVTNLDQINYSLALAAFSQLISTSTSGTPISDGVTQLSTAITNNTLSTVWFGTNGPVASLANNTNLQPGLTNLPVGIAFSPTAYTAIINQPLTITANVTNFDGTPVPAGTSVTFTASGGTLATPTAKTVAGGNATVTLTASTAGTTITVNASATATVSGVPVSVSTKTPALVNVVNNPNDIGSVKLTSSSSTAAINQAVTLTATVGVAGGAENVTAGSPPPAGTVVTFKITNGTGTLSAATAPTNAGGVATVTITSVTAGTVTVTASAGTITSSPATTVSFTQDPLAPATVTVSASPTSIHTTGATNSSTITATITNFAGTALSGVTVNFTTTGGTLSAPSATTVSNGTATVTLTSASAGSGTVTASATADGVTQTGNSPAITFTAPPSPTTVTVIVATSGTLPPSTPIGSIGALLTYTTTVGLTPTSEAASGVAASGSSSDFNTNNPGQIIIDVESTTNNGFSTGQFATITFSIGTGTRLPVASDFTVTAFSSGVTDLNSNTIPGISIVIPANGVTFQ